MGKYNTQPKQVYKYHQKTGDTKRVEGDVYLYRNIYFGINILETDDAMGDYLVVTELTTGAAMFQGYIVNDDTFNTYDYFVMKVMDFIDHKLKSNEWTTAVDNYKDKYKNSYPVNDVKLFSPNKLSYELAV